MLGFKPHIPKEVSNTVLLFCGESSLVQWLWHGGLPPPPPPCNHSGNLRWTFHQTLYFTSHQTQLRDGGQAATVQEEPAALRRAARLPHPCGQGDPGAAGARKSPKCSTERHLWKHCVICSGSVYTEGPRCVRADGATIKELYEQIYSHCGGISDVPALKASCVYPSPV